MNDRHVTELLPAYALGCLDEEESLEVAGHIAGCPACLAGLSSYQSVVDKLAFAAPEIVPPAGLKQRVTGSLQAPRIQPETGPEPSWWQRLPQLFQRSAPAWSLISLVLVVFLLVTNLWWWLRAGREERVVTGGGMQVVAMVGTEAAPEATGTLVISADGEYGTLVVDGLPWLDQERQYQLWLIRDGQRTSGGVFSVNLEGYGALWISSPEPLSRYPAFGITIEPAGGSPGPTGEKVLGGNL